MNHSRSLSAVPFLSLALVACASMVGCVASEEPDATVESAEQAIVDQTGSFDMPAQNELRVERASDAQDLAMVPQAGWKEIAPGVFETEEGASRIFMGVEGHRWAIEQTEKELSTLRAQRGDDADAMEAMKKLEAQLSNLDETMKSIAAQPAPTPQAISCNISFYTGPSSPVSGTYGAAALAQVNCISGCQTFTIAAQACTNFGCTPVYSSSRFVCSTPWTYGVSMSGSYGAFCSSAASVSPPGITSSWNGSCG